MDRFSAHESFLLARWRATRRGWPAVLFDGVSNPERVGRRDGNKTQALVRRQLKREARKEIDFHLMQCSPCFTEYVGLREAREKSVKTTKSVGIAVLILPAVNVLGDS